MYVQRDSLVKMFALASLQLTLCLFVAVAVLFVLGAQTQAPHHCFKRFKWGMLALASVSKFHECLDALLPTESSPGTSILGPFVRVRQLSGMSTSKSCQR